MVYMRSRATGLSPAFRTQTHERGSPRKLRSHRGLGAQRCNWPDDRYTHVLRGSKEPKSADAVHAKAEVFGRAAPRRTVEVASTRPTPRLGSVCDYGPVLACGGTIAQALALRDIGIFLCLRQGGRSESSSAMPDISTPAPVSEKQVFVIDDDAAVRSSLSSLLRSVGLQVSTFSSAAEFLSSHKPDVPSCLVLDVRLPGVGGLEFQAELANAA
jgi:CheY-like chemotaxis protein